MNTERGPPRKYEDLQKEGPIELLKQLLKARDLPLPTGQTPSDQIRLRKFNIFRTQLFERSEKS